MALVVGIACPVAGWFAFLVPFELARDAGTTQANNLVDGMQWISLLGIAGIGFVAGAILPQGWPLWGPLSMAAFPCKAVIDMFRDPTTHNLWPFEFAFYAVFALPGVLGAGLGALFRRHLVDRPTGRGEAAPPNP